MSSICPVQLLLGCDDIPSVILIHVDIWIQSIQNIYIYIIFLLPHFDQCAFCTILRTVSNLFMPLLLIILMKGMTLSSMRQNSLLIVFPIEKQSNDNTRNECELFLQLILGDQAKKKGQNE